MLYSGKRFLSYNKASFYDIKAPVCADVTVVPIFEDNYAYILVDRESRRCAFVDPADATAVLNVAQSKGLSVDTVLCTHKHWDHAGGNEKIAKLKEGIDIVSTAYEEIPAVTKALKDRQTIDFGSLQIQLLYTPCHTKGHVLFYVTSKHFNDPQSPILFSGDTLFVGGCGRFFEGSAADMHYALHSVISKLPLKTHVFCGHEYTQSNLKFALSVDATNLDLQNKMRWVTSRLKQNAPTIPSTIEEELRYNPFMRPHDTQLRKSLGLTSTTKDEDVIKKLRFLKDSFA